MKIVFYEVRDWEIKHLKRFLKGHELKFIKEKLNSDNLKEAAHAEVISVIIYSRVDAEVLKALPKLKLVATRSTGFDHIDVAACKKSGIKVANVPFYGENTVAEHTFALILSLSRNIHKSYIRSSRGDYSIDGLKGFDLKDKTLGVIGAGRIGLHVIRIAKSFSMRVVAFDVHRDTFLSEVLGFEYAEFDDVLKQSDILSLHAPHNKHTHHMINMDTVKIIKKGALLINTSRGALVENQALLYALEKKIISGAGLDVIEEEEKIKEEKQLLHDDEKSSAIRRIFNEHILAHKENVVFTPHIGFYSEEALLRILSTTADNIKNFQLGAVYFDVSVPC